MTRARRLIVRVVGGLPVLEAVATATEPTTVVPTRTVSRDEAFEVGTKLGVEWAVISMEEFRHGIEVEMGEHGTRDPDLNVIDDSLEGAARIALSHLHEDPQYYTKLYQAQL